MTDTSGEEHPILRTLVARYPDVRPCIGEIAAAFDVLHATYRGGGKVLLCGNGGSAADCDHIVGELMKGFLRPRPLPPPMRDRLAATYGAHGDYLATHLQGALPAISLASHVAVLTAYANDVAADMAFAQQVYGYGRPGDVLRGISTSGNARTVLHALQVARVLHLRTIGLTGRDGGALSALRDVVVRVPRDGTVAIQEGHLPIYHALCIMREEALFDT